MRHRPRCYKVRPACFRPPSCSPFCSPSPGAPRPREQTATQPTPQQQQSATNLPAELKPALDSVNADDLMRHTKTLASDEYEGRGPGTRGEELSVKYLTGEFQRMGLKPGNPDGTYVQKVPLAGLKAEPRLTLSAGGRQTELKYPDDYVAVSRRFVPEIARRELRHRLRRLRRGRARVRLGRLQGRGREGQDHRHAHQRPGGARLRRTRAKLDEKMFKGKAMTYYGRWTYKYEIASEKGAAAAIIVHETGPAGYPYEVVKGSWAQENFDIQTPDKNMGRVGVESWIHLDRAKELFTVGGAGLRRAEEGRRVARTSSRSRSTRRRSFAVKNTLREVQSHNVVAKLEGSDPNLKNEYVVYTAHWDHLGKNDTLQGDQIYNGAVDNASGIGALLELAEAFTKLPTPPKRSVLFLAVTAEEKGLLGAKYYATNPLYPLARTLANINMDGANQWGRTRDIVIVGDGNSTLDDLAREVAATQGRAVTPDPETEKGFYYRSDHFEFAKQGVPALYPDTGTEYVGKPRRATASRSATSTRTSDYHKPTDEVKPDWDLSGAVEDAQFLLHRRPPRRRRATSTPSGSPAPSSRRSATRC